MLIHRHRLALVMLCIGALAAGCTASSQRISTAKPEPQPLARSAEKHVVAMTPAQALAPQARDARVRWSGGINAIEAQEGERQCLTLLQATFDDRQVLHWPREAQNFVACGPGDYDPKLVSQFTLVSLEGRVTGQRMFLGRPVPVIEIETLYRHSDCVQGSEQSPACYSGLLAPRKP